MNDRDKQIRVRFNPEILPYLSQLKSNYTSYNVEYLLTMNSTYSMRFYEILLSYDNGDTDYGYTNGLVFQPVTKEILDLIVKKDMNRLQDNLKKLWVWMGNYFNNIIVLISVASVFAEAIKKLKGIDVLCGMLSHIGGAVIIVAIAMAAIQIGTALLTGSSNAPWYAFGSMGADMAATLGVHNGLLLVPMHLTGGLSRCFSPFCGAMIAVSGMVEAEPMALCKRNAVPMLFGVLETQF